MTNRNDFFYGMLETRLKTLLKYETGLKIADEYDENSIPCFIIYLGDEGNQPTENAALVDDMSVRGCEFTINLFLRKQSNESSAITRSEAHAWIDRIEVALQALNNTPYSYTHTVDSEQIYTLNCKSVAINTTSKFYATKATGLTGIQIVGQIDFTQTYS